MKLKGMLGIAALTTWIGCAPGLPLNSGTTSVSVSASPSPSPSINPATICSGTTINGLAGTASCAVSGVSQVVALETILASGAARDPAQSQITSIQETSIYAGTDLPSPGLVPGYREIPIVLQDDDGGDITTTPPLRPVPRFARGAGGNFGLWNAAVPRKMCGMGIATLADRIKDCDTQHSTKPSWDAVSGDSKLSWTGAASGNGLAAEGSWTLVTVYSNSSMVNGTVCPASNVTDGTSCTEVWRDDRTGLLWSDRIGSTTLTTANVGRFNWCIASGNTENVSADCRTSAGGGGAGVSSNYVGISLCAEAAGLTTPVGITNTVGEQVALPSAWTEAGTAVRDAKGGMMKSTTADHGVGPNPSIRWRLPTRWDFQQADNDGIRLVLPNLNAMALDNFWSATLNSTSRSGSWVFQNTTGVTTSVARTSVAPVRCVGR